MRATYYNGRASGLFSVIGLKFLLAHEAAHFLLRHKAATSGFVSSAHLPVCSDHKDIELAADDLAFQLVRQHAEGLDARSDMSLFSLVGAVLATWAVDSVERAEFVRTGNSHPPAAVRAERLLAKDRGLAARAIPGAFAAIRRATDTAVNFDVALSAAQWTSFFDSDRFRPVSDLAMNATKVLALDAAHCASHADCVSVVEEIFSERPDVRFGLLKLLDGDLATALRAWQVADADAAMICDPVAPLTFATLKECLADGLDVDIDDVSSVYLARLVEEEIKKGASQ